MVELELEYTPVTPKSELLTTIQTVSWLPMPLLLSRLASKKYIFEKTSVNCTGCHHHKLMLLICSSSFLFQVTSIILLTFQGSVTELYKAETAPPLTPLS